MGLWLARRNVERWPAEGEPERPAAWISTTARRRLIDVLRRRRIADDKIEGEMRWKLDCHEDPG